MRIELLHVSLKPSAVNDDFNYVGPKVYDPIAIRNRQQKVQQIAQEFCLLLKPPYYGLVAKL